MDTLQTILSRRSIGDWAKKNVPDKIISQILGVGRHSPSPLNSQPWHFIVVKNKKTIKALMKYAHHGVSLSHANTIIVVTVERKAETDQWLFEHEQFLCSGACALYNMWLASYELGLGSCWVTLDELKTEEILSIPSRQKVVGSLATGYPKEGAHKEVPRKELFEITSYEKYGKKKDDVNGKMSKSSNILEFMEKDHDRLDEVFDEFRNMRSTDITKARPLFHDFKIGLQRHIVWEEEILFPIFENKTGMHDTGPSVVMRMEHRKIKDFLEKIHDSIARGENKVEGLENDLVEVLTEHNNKEENILYPWIDNETSEQERNEAFTKMENLPAEKYNKCCE